MTEKTDIAVQTVNLWLVFAEETGVKAEMREAIATTLINLIT